MSCFDLQLNVNAPSFLQYGFDGKKGGVEIWDRSVSKDNAGLRTGKRVRSIPWFGEPRRSLSFEIMRGVVEYTAGAVEVL